MDRAFSVISRLNVHLLYDPANANARHLSKRNGSICPFKDLYMNLIANLFVIHNCKYLMCPVASKWINTF